MADRYDPKLSGRPPAERKAGQPAGEDPLFELAKLVQGRSSAPATPAPTPPPAPARARTVPPADDTLPTASEQADAFADLEAELLSDLQASFAAVKGAISPPPLAPVAEAPPQPAAPSPPPPPTPKLAEPAMRAVPPPPPPATPAPQGQPSRFAAARPPLQVAPPLHLPPATPMPEPAAARAPAPPQPIRPAAASNEARVDIANLQIRPTVPPPVKPQPAAAPPVAEAPAPAAKDKGSRWERPLEPVKSQPGLASRFAPPRAAGATAQPVPSITPPSPSTENLDDLPFSDGPPFGAPQEQDEEEFTLDGLDLGPALGDDEQIPPYPDDELEGLGRRRVPRAAIILGGVLAVAIIGGAAAMLLRSGGSGTTTPPVILADTSPTKVAPPASQAPAANDPQNKLIYDRVESRGASPPADTKLVTPGSEKIASVPPAANDSPISRVILPGAPTGDGKPATAPAAAAPPAGDAELGADGKPIGPRKVRTVVVKPDGTIVSSEAAPADAARPQPGAATVPPVLPPAQNDDTAAIAGQPGGQELAITPIPGTPTSLPPEKAQQTAVPRPQAAPQPVVRNDPPPAAKVVQPQPKVVDSSAPLDLTPGRPATRAPAQQQAMLPPAQPVQPAPVAGGGMLVQVSSQRSEDAARATYRDLQARYPNVLGSYQPNIQRADLGDRGVYYRVRVGPLAGSDAQRLCDALKSAGGDCVLAAR